MRLLLQVHLLLEDCPVVTLEQELFLVRELGLHLLADLLLQTKLFSWRLGGVIEHSLDCVALEIGRDGFLYLRGRSLIDLAIDLELEVSQVRFEVLDLLSEQARFPLPERLQVVLLHFNCHLVLLEVDHRVAQDLDGRHRRCIALAVAHARHTGVAAWEIFEPRGDFVFQLLNRFLAEKGLLEVLGALVVVLLGLVDEALDEGTEFFGFLGGCLDALVQDEVGLQVTSPVSRGFLTGRGPCGVWACG